MRPVRSLLIVPADSERKIAKALDTTADAIVLDLEDSVMPERKTAARSAVAEVLSTSSQNGRLWVRINSLSSGDAVGDLCAIVSPTLAGIILPKASGPRDVETTSNFITALSAKIGLSQEGPGILAVATETAAAPFALGDYHQAGLSRLWGLTWGAEDLSSAIGAVTNKADNGEWAFTYKMVRSQCLLAAKACGVNCVETVYVDYKDLEGLKASCVEARREGFTGRFAIHPAQVDPINEGFMPSLDDVERARSIIAAFEGAGAAGAVGLDGQMLDIPHLNQARHVLSLAAAFERA